MYGSPEFSKSSMFARSFLTNNCIKWALRIHFSVMICLRMLIWSNHQVMLLKGSRFVNYLK